MTVKRNEKVLSEAIHELRGAAISPEHLARQSADFFASRKTAPEQGETRGLRRWWSRSLLQGFAVAAAASLLTWFLTRPSTPPPSALISTPSQPLAAEVVNLAAETDLIITGVGTRVALAPQARSRYQIETTNTLETTVHLQAGALPLRLYHSESEPHHTLRVYAGNLLFEAKGTIYTVEMLEAGPALAVHEGEVWVRNAEGEVVARRGAGEVWPDSFVPSARILSSASRLRAHSLVGSARPARQEATAVDEAGTQLSLAQMWKRARSLRVEGKVGEAIALLKTLKQTGDKVWVPLALLEQIRIYHGARTELPNAETEMIRLAEDFIRLFPAHDLTDEMLEMLCPIASVGANFSGTAMCGRLP